MFEISGDENNGMPVSFGAVTALKNETAIYNNADIG